jgi:hypothetical protein
MASTKTQSITPAQYQEMLDIRRAAMQGFADGTVDAATKNTARAAVRNARKVLKAEGVQVVNGKFAIPEAPKRTRKPRAPKAEVTPEQA